MGNKKIILFLFLGRCLRMYRTTATISLIEAYPLQSESFVSLSWMFIYCWRQKESDFWDASCEQVERQEGIA